MSASTDYMNSLIGLAKAAYERDRAAVEGERSRKVGGTWQSDTQGNITSYSPGTTGEYDVAYDRNRRAAEGSLESRGILKSGQAATTRQNLLGDYQQSVLDYLRGTQHTLNTLYGDYLTKEGQYRAQYGTEPESTTPSTPKTENKQTGSNEPSTPPTPSMPSSTNKPAAERAPYEAAAFQALGQPESIAQIKPPPAPTQTYDNAVGNVLFGSNVPWDQIDTSGFTNPNVGTPAPSNTLVKKALATQKAKAARRG